MMKNKHALSWIAAICLETILTINALVRMQFDPGRGQIIDYPTLRLILVVVQGAVLLVLGMATVLLVRDRAGRILAWLDGRLSGPQPRLFLVQGGLLVLGVFFFECFLLSYFAIPVPARPFLVWASAACFTTWLALRLAYVPAYRSRPSLFARLRLGWDSWQPVQRRTFLVVAVIGLVCFLAFAPFNYRLDEAGHFIMHSDEDVIYPDVARALVTDAPFDELVRRNVEHWPFWYGYPYLPISAAVLIVPRLIFGNGFIDQVQLNIFLLRQFVSVLPMILAIGFLTYLVTGFRSLWRAGGLFAFLLLVPGVVKYNYMFWHPDGLILLLVVLTLFFLQRDRLRFGRDFYLAALTCGLAAAIKVWGLFFFLTIAGVLVAGLVRRILTFKTAVRAGILFLLVMLVTIAVSSPALLAPQPLRTFIGGLQYESGVIAHGYDEPDPTGAYQPGLVPWLRYFDIYYMESYFFFAAFAALTLGSLLGSARPLNRLLLSWCLVLAVYMIGFTVIKRFHYMLPLMMPLYAAPILLPALAEGGGLPRGLSFLGKPLAAKVLWALTLLLYAVQFIFNLVTITTSPWMGF